MRPKNQRTGALRHRCTIQQTTETQDSSGQPIVSWSPYVVDEPCQFTPTAGIESMRGRQLEAGTRAVFRVRYRSGYTVQMRVVYQGETYGITAVNMVDGLRNYIDIICAAVLP
jgi:SPP1 family predicted phage head-tail adaptor